MPTTETNVEKRGSCTAPTAALLHAPLKHVYPSPCFFVEESDAVLVEPLEVMPCPFAPIARVSSVKPWFRQRPAMGSQNGVSQLALMRVRIEPVALFCSGTGSSTVGCFEGHP